MAILPTTFLSIHSKINMKRLFAKCNLLYKTLEVNMSNFGSGGHGYQIR